MNAKQTLYFMTLVGGIAGLLTWVLQLMLSDLVNVSQENQWILVCAYTTLMGGSIAGLTVAFADRWTADQLLFRWIAVGVGLGVGAGAVSGLLYQVLFGQWLGAAPGGWVGFANKILPWAITGSLTGFVTGLRWVGVNKARPFHGLAGGLIGGTVGGVLFSSVGAGDLFQAVGFMCAGMGITLAIAVAPVLLAAGVIRFVDSSDVRTQEKYALFNQEWVLQSGDRYVVGNLGADMTMTMYARDVDLFFPDEAMAPRHAIISSQGGQFFIEPHPQNVGLHGGLLAPLRIAENEVDSRRQLKSGDLIEVGNTRLFFSKKGRAFAPASVAPARAPAAESLPKPTEQPSTEVPKPFSPPEQPPPPVTPPPAQPTVTASAKLEQDAEATLMFQAPEAKERKATRSSDSSSLEGLLTDQPHDPLQVVPVFISVLEALKQIEESGKEHPHLHPGNIKLEKSGSVRVPSQPSGKSEKEGTLFIPDPKYAAPELFSKGHQVGKEATDLYVVAYIFYEIFLGRELFNGEFATFSDSSDRTFQWFNWHCDTNTFATPLVKLIPETPLALSEILEKMMSKKPEGRPQSFDDVVAILSKLQSTVLRTSAETVVQTSTKTPRPSSPKRGFGWNVLTPKGLLIPLTAAAAVLLLLIILFLF